MRSFLISFGKYKDGVTTFLAILFVFVGFYQYFEYRSDKRIETALQLLERREGRVFVEARTKLLQTWFEADGSLADALKRTDFYTEELYKEIDSTIHADKQYRTAMLHISSFYSNASACVLDGLCDQPTICSSLHGEIQDYLDINRNYFVFLRTLRDEDSVSLYLHLPEFVGKCDETIFFSLFSRVDSSNKCRFARSLYRTTGFILKDFCKEMTAPYTQGIIDRAKASI